jgi:membrane protease YdiL (CAAX protease family)
MTTLLTDNTASIDHNVLPRPIMYPTVRQAWWLVGFFILIQLPASIPAAVLTYLAGRVDQPWLKPAGEMMAYVVALCLTIWYGFKKRENRELAFGSAPVLAYVVAALGLVAMGVLVEPLIAAIPMPERLKEIIAKLFTKDMIFIAVLAAPVLEEVLFRWIILDGLLKNYSPVKAILWSGIMFGYAHIIPTQAVNAMFIGFALGWVYYRSRSLYLCMFLHFVNNALSSLTFLVDDEMDMSANLTRGLVGNDTYYVGVLVGCAAICYGCYAYLNQSLPRTITSQPVQ